MSDIQDWHATDSLHAEQGQGDPFAAAVRATRMAMIITDPRQPDNPIVFANAAFLPLERVRARGGARVVTAASCRAPGTDPAAVASIREAVAARRDIAIDILNYRKDGSAFWNGLYISPCHDSVRRAAVLLRLPARRHRPRRRRRR